MPGQVREVAPGQGEFGRFAQAPADFLLSGRSLEFSRQRTIHLDGALHQAAGNALVHPEQMALAGEAVGLVIREERGTGIEPCAPVSRGGLEAIKQLERRSRWLRREHAE